LDGFEKKVSVLQGGAVGLQDIPGRYCTPAGENDARVLGELQASVGKSKLFRPAPD
jgi:hypothetical protein